MDYLFVILSIFPLFLLPNVLNAENGNNSREGVKSSSSSEIPEQLQPQSQNSPLTSFLFESQLWKKFLQHRDRDEKPRLTGRKTHGLSSPEIIRNAGFRSEIHTLTTEDDYILTVDRILGRIKDEEDSAGNGGKKPAVLLFPNMMACSDGWFINSPEKSMPLLLAERNFDVWIANPRGCTNSRKHKWKNPKSAEFWNFSWHEMGVYDLSAMIDHILAETGHSKLNYIGYSLGTTVGFVLLSEKPEYNQKLNMSIHLGPAAYIGLAKSPVIQSGAKLSQLVPFSSISSALTGGSGELVPKTALALNLYRSVCRRMEKTCWTFVYATMGFDNCQHDKKNTPRFLEFTPSGTSLASAVHYLQLVNNGLFRQFDFGEEGNRIRYKNPSPPNYNLSNVQSPQILFYSDGDWLVHPEDAKRTASEFSPKARVMMCRVKFSSFNHLDFLVAKDVNLLVNDRILRVLHGDSCWTSQNDNENDSNHDNEDEESIKCPPENSLVNSEKVKRVLETLNKWIVPILKQN